MALFLLYLVHGGIDPNKASGRYERMLSSDRGRIVWTVLSAFLLMMVASMALRLARGKADVVVDDWGIDAAGVPLARRAKWSEISSISAVHPWVRDMKMVTITKSNGNRIRLLPDYREASAEEFRAYLHAEWHRRRGA